MLMCRLGQDKTSVKILAQAKAADESSVVVMAHPRRSGTLQDARQLVKAIRDVLRTNRSVVLRGWRPEVHITFGLDDAQYLYVDVNHFVEAQSRSLQSLIDA